MEEILLHITIREYGLAFTKKNAIYVPIYPHKYCMDIEYYGLLFK